MQEITVSAREAGQRMDKYLARYLSEAPKSFLYKMMRKKNITLNGKKCEGSEKLKEGDVLRLFLAEETLAKFRGRSLTEQLSGSEAGERSPDAKGGLSRSGDEGGASRLAGLFAEGIIYEDRNIILFNKPAGLLSQKAAPEDVSAVEWALAYLREKGELTEEDYRRFHPSVCNRLDRNTSGLLIIGKTMAGLQTMSAILKDRTVHKDYLCLVEGRVEETRHVRAYLGKDERTNRVTVSESPFCGARPIETWYRPLECAGGLTRLCVRLVTGRSHKIRAHLAYLGHPIVGDSKYAGPDCVQRWRRLGVRRQLLHAWKLTFPEITGELSFLSGRVFTAPEPELFKRTMSKNERNRDC